ncbi:MAG TPA: HIT family protein [Candidatus Paceibacterota bacterium]
MKDCVFCKIVAGELPSYKLYEDDKTLAFLDIHPVHPGHTLVIPKRHSENIFEIDSGDWMAVAQTVRTVAPAIETATKADGVNLLMNNRETAGQVVGHAHVHLIPRFRGDGLKLWPHKDYKAGETEDVLVRIRAALQ